ncbi:MAG: phospho-sugar mutase, partial [Polyangiaceae bacterium]|nr:phospho-sugar mutase [Polyangiaceae bacterium]
GAQIVPPIDAAIAQAIASAPAVSAIPREGSGELVPLGDREIERYLAAIAPLSRPGPGGAQLSIANTGLHGVGEPIARRALGDAGFTSVASVASQSAPDPAFSTVSSPNPEEPEALEAVLGLADAIGADLVLANDPDADRLAVATRHAGALRVLSGNELGCLLGHYLLERDGGGPDALVLSTFVSSPMLGDIARAHGAVWAATLTGHKWIHNEAIRREAEGMRFVFGYEEALGYAAGRAVRDKDGISAAVLVAEVAREQKAKGRSLIDELETMATRYGKYVSRQRSETYEGAAGEARIAERMSRARRTPPETLGGCRVLATSDFLEGVRTFAGREPERLEVHTSDVIQFELEGGHRATIRPSGTEPKLKLYVDVRVGPGGACGDEASELAERILCALAA